MKHRNSLPGIVIVLLTLTLLLSPPAQASGDQARQDALEQVKTELIQKLKEKGHEGLADKLSGINPEKLGDFLGSAAGGDFDRAFNIAGSSSANYLYDKFKENLSGRLDEIIQPNSPAAQMMKYIPWNPADGKKIAIELLNGNISAAANKLTSMVKKESRPNLEKLSKDIVAGGIDWVLEPTVGAGAGAVFLKAIELEIQGIKWFETWSKDYLNAEKQKQYNDLRKKGLTPKQAIDIIMENSGQLAFARAYFHGNLNKAREYLEVQYARSREITPQTLEEQRKTQAENIAGALSVELFNQEEIYEKRLKQELLKIFAEAAKNNDELKTLTVKSKDARDNIDAIKAETTKLEAYWQKLEKVFDIRRMEKRKQAMEKRLAEFKQATQRSAIKNCSRIDSWSEHLDQKLDAIDATFERMREIGHESRKITQKICENSEDKALVKKAMLALKKRFGYIEVLKNEMSTLKTEALANLKKLVDLKHEIKTLLEQQNNIDSALNKIIAKWEKLLKAVQKSVNTPTEAVEQLFTGVQNIVNDPIFNRFKGKFGSIRYTLMADAKKAEQAFEKQKNEVESGIQKLSDSLAGFDGIRRKATEQKQALDKALGGCLKLKDLNPSQYQNRIKQMGQKWEKYRKAFNKLNRKAKDCAGKTADELSSDALTEAKKLLDKARERTGVVIDKSMVAETAKNDLVGVQASISAALALVSTPAGGNPENLIIACKQAQSKSKKLQDEIQSATAASAGHMANLKKAYVAATNARKSACGKAMIAEKTKDQQKCDQIVAEALAQATIAKESAETASQAAAKMKTLYNQLKSKSNLKTFDELLRKIPAAIQSLKEQISKANAKLADIDVESIGTKIQQAQSAAAKANTTAEKVNGLVGQIRGLLGGHLLAGIDPALADDADKIYAAAAMAKEIAQRNSKAAGKAATVTKASGQKAIAQVKEVEAKIEMLSATLESLSSCRNTDVGGDLNDLRTNSDMGEIFGPGTKAAADNASMCAKLAASTCKTNKEAFEANETRNDAGDCNCQPGYVCDHGKCVSPFDSDYDKHTDTLTDREDDRNQKVADQVSTDQSGQNRDRFTSKDLDHNLDTTQNDISKRRKNNSEPTLATTTPTPTPTPTAIATPAPEAEKPTTPTTNATATPKPAPTAAPAPALPSNRNLEWHAREVCAENEGPDYRWRWHVVLRQSGTNVTGNISFHKCPGGGRLSYRLTGKVAANGSFNVTGSKNGGRGGLYGSAPSRQTFILQEGKTPTPNF